MLQGIGAHTGRESILDMSILDKPLCFVVNGQTIPAHLDYVSDTTMSTQLTHKSQSVRTVEHFLSACAALDIQNLKIQLSHSELPIMDGSSKTFYNQLLPYKNSTKREIYVVKTPIRVEDESGWVELTPSDEIVFDVKLKPSKRSHPLFDNNNQHYKFYWTKDDYFKEISPARTFGFLEDGAILKSKGLALGVSLDNAVILTKDGIANPNGLRFTNELARHKILDAIGDLYLTGYLIQGKYTALNPSHKLNIALAHKMVVDQNK